MLLLKRRWFLILLCIVLVVGIVAAEQLADFAESIPTKTIISTVLFAMALPLRFATIAQTLSRPKPTLLAVAINLLVVPCLAWLAGWLLIDELALGAIIAAAVPCTLASAAVWTRLAGGNEAVSLMVTMITNLACFLTTPAILKFFTARTTEQIVFGEMATKLMVLIVLPMVVAQLLRPIEVVGNFADRHKPALGIYAQLGILSIVFVGAVQAGRTLAALDDSLGLLLGQIALMLLLMAVIHLLAWGLGFWSAPVFGISRRDQIAVAFAGSQKTLMVGLAIALQFGGLAALPMLAYHVEQLLLDTVLADRLKHAA